MSPAAQPPRAPPRPPSSAVLQSLQRWLHLHAMLSPSSPDPNGGEPPPRRSGSREAAAPPQGLAANVSFGFCQLRLQRWALIWGKRANKQNVRRLQLRLLRSAELRLLA